MRKRFRSAFSQPAGYFDILDDPWTSSKSAEVFQEALADDRKWWMSTARLIVIEHLIQAFGKCLTRCNTGTYQK
jgi:hypothetical protein